MILMRCLLIFVMLGRYLWVAIRQKRLAITVQVRTMCYRHQERLDATGHGGGVQRLGWGGHLAISPVSGDSNDDVAKSVKYAIVAVFEVGCESLRLDKTGARKTRALPDAGQLINRNVDHYAN